MNIKIKKFILLIGDILILYTSLYLTLLIRYQGIPSEGLWSNHFGPFSFIFIFWLIIFYITNLYNINIAVNNSRFYQKLTKTLIISGLLSAAYFYLNPSLNIAPKRNLIIFIVVFAVLFSIWRNLFNYLIKTHAPKINIAFIGHNKQVEELITFLKDKPHLGYFVSFVINEENKNISSLPIYDNINDLKNLISKKNINTVVLAQDPSESNNLRSILFDCLSLGTSFVGLSKFYEDITGKIPVNVINKMWFLENLNEGNKKFFDYLKKTYDFILALAIFIITLPFWIIIGLALKIENKESIFFIQKRVGKNGKIFRLIKFRTQKTIKNNPDPAEHNDSRTTKVGNFMRKTRIDEFTQMINILKGEMSFVGPRPERPELAETLEKQIPFFNERTLVKPGITGWDQISGEYHSPNYEDTMKKIQYDLFYIKNRSIYLDLSIILKTIATILSKGGI